MLTVARTVGSQTIKGISNVHVFQFVAQRRHCPGRRIHHRIAVHLGRDFAADRLKKHQSKEIEMNGRFLINRRDAKVMGVAAGLADYTGVDPLLVRLGFVAATLITGPVMILFYLLAGFLAPRV
jgi:phage shock protein C